MASEKRLILSVDRNEITLPKELIPENVAMFVYDLQEDGQIILTPFDAISDSLPFPATPPKPDVTESQYNNVIDFRAARLRIQNRRQKKNKSLSSPRPEENAPKATGFVKLHHFHSRLEAEMMGEILEQSEIPYLIQSDDIGIFGSGGSPVPGGACIAVRMPDLEDAKSLLSGLI